MVLMSAPSKDLLDFCIIPKNESYPLLELLVY